MYNKSCVLVVGCEEEYPVFGDVTAIYVANHHVLFRVCILHTAAHDPHYHGFIVKRTTDVRYIKYDDLISL